MKRNLIAIAFATALPLGALAQMGSPTSPGGPPAKAPSSSAAPGAARDAASVSPLDTNKDGFVSRDEAKRSGELSARFKELDKDHDGKLSAQELGGAPKTKY